MNTTDTIHGKSTVFPTLAEVQKMLAAQPKEDPVDSSATALLRHVDWPSKSDKRQMESFFGPIELNSYGLPTRRWENQKLVDLTLPFPMRLAHDPTVRITVIYCHAEVKASLSRILEAIWEHYKKDLAAIQIDGVDLLGVTYQYGADQYGSLKMSSYGASISIDPLRPRPGKGRPPTKKQLPADVIAFCLSEGWTYQGAKSDDRTFEAARP